MVRSSLVYSYLLILCLFLVSFYDSPIIQNKNFVIVVPSYNNEDWYLYNLNSIFDQSYENYRVIYIDDCSTDKTYQLVKDYINKSNKLHKITLIRNERNQGALANHFKTIHMCDDDEIIVCLDGDDWFANNNVLKLLNAVYQNKNVWLTYSQYNYWPMNELGSVRMYPYDVVKNNRFREFGFICPQGRTYYAWLAKKVKLQDLLFDEEPYVEKFYPTAGDVALMFPMLEMAGERFKFINKVLTHYNQATPLNDNKVYSDLQLYITEKIQKKEKYKRLIQL